MSILVRILQQVRMTIVGKEAEEFIFDDLNGGTVTDDSALEIDLDAGTPGVRTARIAPDVSPDASDPEFDDLPGDRGPSQSGRAPDSDSQDPGFSKKFNARLERERQAKIRERERADAAERRAAQLEARLRETRKTGHADATKALDTQIASTESELEQALEAGDSKQQVRLTSQLTDLKARRIAAEYVGPDDLDDDPGDVGGDTSAKPAPNPLVEEFLSGHRDWFKKRGFERYTTLLESLDKEVFAEGFNPADEEYFEELEARLKQKAPEMWDETGELDPTGAAERRREQRAGRRSPVAPGVGSGRHSAPAASGNKVSLDAEDFANMRRFGLDTRDPATLKEYARSKRQRMLEDQARGR
jgi:hypothetical protein